jgi:hypothetical protein
VITIISVFCTSGGLAFSYCSGAACRDDLAEQGVFVSFCAFKKKKLPKKLTEIHTGLKSNGYLREGMFKYGKGLGFIFIHSCHHPFLHYPHPFNKSH